MEKKNPCDVCGKIFLECDDCPLFIFGTTTKECRNEMCFLCNSDIGCELSLESKCGAAKFN